MLGRFIYGDDISHYLIFIMGLLSSQKSAGPAGPPGVSFEGPQAILWAIGPRARLILTPGCGDDPLQALWSLQRFPLHGLII